MKQTFFHTTLVALLLLMPTAAMGYDFEADGIYYNINRDSVSVSVTNTSYHYYSGHVTIPNAVTFGDIDYPVTAIGDFAFDHSSNLTHVTIPESVKFIGNHAFGDCLTLTTVDLSNSVDTIDDYAFLHCRDLPEIILPDSLKSIGYGAFSYCTSLTHITIPDGVTEIVGEAFNGCTALASVTLGESVTDIGNKVFGGCNKLTTITIPESVTSLGYGAFDECTGIKTLVYNAINCETPPDYSLWIFSDCPLDTVIFGNNVQHIPHYLLAEQRQLNSVTIPNSVTSIGNNVFQLSSVTSVTIGSGVTSIGNRLFLLCSQLRDVICLAATPPSVDGEFFHEMNYYAQAQLHVLPGALEKYQSAPYWQNFSQILGDVVIDIPGDVDGDGKITIADVSGVIDVIINGGSHGHNHAPLPEDEFFTCDFNGDGDINIQDVVDLIDFLLSGGVNR